MCLTCGEKSSHSWGQNVVLHCLQHFPRHPKHSKHLIRNNHCCYHLTSSQLADFSGPQMAPSVKCEESLPPPLSELREANAEIRI